MKSPQITKWILKLLFLFFILAFVAYIFYLNHETAVFYITKTDTFTAPLAMIVLVAFCIGILLTSTIAILLGLHQKLLLWSIKSDFSRFEKISNTYIKGRAFSAIDELNKAEAQAKKIVALDATHIPANILLANIAEKRSDLATAISIIEKIDDGENFEVLLYSALLNQKAENYLIANDKFIKLFKAKSNNLTVLNGLVTTNVALKYYDEAIKYQEKIISNCTSTSEIPGLENKLAELKLQALLEENIPEKELNSRLTKLAKKYPNCSKISSEIEKRYM